jgi:enoyl-CoA hydratase/carnithine racemase
VSTLIRDRGGGVLWLRLNRPQARNGIDVELRDELTDADRDRGVRAIVVTGVGPDFCIGADLAAASGKV